MGLRKFGVSSEYGQLTAVLLYAPGPEVGGLRDPRKILHLRPIDHKALALEFESIFSLLADLGVRVVRIDPSPMSEDRLYLYNMMYCRDLMLMTPEGAILANMAEPVRREEVRYAGRALEASGVPVLHAVSGGRFEGADALWLTEGLVMVGVGNRTDVRGYEQVRAALARIGVGCVAVPASRTRTQHLLGVVQIVDRDLACVRREVAAPEVLRLLEDHGFAITGIPENDEVLQRQAMNILTVSPGRLVMTAGCPETRDIYLKAGLEIAAEIGLTQLISGAGGLACATGIIARG